MAYQLATKSSLKQYDFNEYKNQEDNKGEKQVLNKNANSPKSEIRKIIFSFALNFFRHVSYLAIVSFIFFLQVLGISDYFILNTWFLFLSLIILKELLFLIHVVSTNFIQKKFHNLILEAKKVNLDSI